MISKYYLVTYSNLGTWVQEQLLEHSLVTVITRRVAVCLGTGTRYLEDSILYLQDTRQYLIWYLKILFIIPYLSIFNILFKSILGKWKILFQDTFSQILYFARKVPFCQLHIKPFLTVTSLT